MIGDQAGATADSECKGRNTENTVQLLPDVTLLRTRMVPLCLLRIFDVTHSPRPVPTSRLVVKNGSKSFWRTSNAIPRSVIADSQPNARSFLTCVLMRRRHPDEDASVIPDGIDAVVEQIGEELA